jgi:hypothetical protein
MTSDHTESHPHRPGRRETPTGKGASWDAWRVGDEPLVHVEFEATTERDVAPTGHGDPCQGVSASRVVREPGRWSRLVVVVAVVGALAGGLLWWVGDRGSEDGQSSGSASDARPTRVAFREAVNRLNSNGSFAYEGEVHAAERSVFRPGDWTARDVTVEGAVLTSHGLTRDVAVDATGRAVETVTSGPTVWTRSASSVDGLGDERWAFRSAPGPAPLGTAAIARLMFSATGPSEAAREATGRRVIHATLPVADPREGYGHLLDDAELLLTLDAEGDIARIAVRSAARGDPDLVLELDIMRVGEPQAIAVPQGGDAGLRRTVPVDELDAVGVRPVELGRVPEGWTLVGAWVIRAPEGPAECLRLVLSYRDPGAVSHGFMTLRVTTPKCGWMDGGEGEPEPLTAGSFEGAVVQAASGLTGDLVDGTTRVGFLTDLSAEDAATLLASLRPFDPDREPTSLAGIPSD